jgi:hypothetical protein
MIFKPNLIQAIQQGKKTMTRRPLKFGEKSCRYKPDHVYSIQPGRGRKAVCQITVTDVRAEPLGNLTLDDARREGFRTIAEFYEYWHRLYGPPTSPGVRDMERRLAELDSETEAARAFIASIEDSRRRRSERLPLPALPVMVWVISFVKGDVRDAPRLIRASAPQAPVCKAPLRGPDGEIVYKPSGKKKPVLCNRAFEDGQDVCKCGAYRPDETGEDHGYTTRTRQAMSDEPEAISTADELKIVKAARKGEAQLSLKPVRDRRERLEKEVMGLHQELAERGAAHRDLERHLGRIERALEQIDGLLEHTA